MFVPVVHQVKIHTFISKCYFEFSPQMGEGRLRAGEAEQGLGACLLWLQCGADLSVASFETVQLVLNGYNAEKQTLPYIFSYSTPERTQESQ